tara:strand:+ start:369 stop:965 length:597 start_codon:yes stop_codon:yes gene_type:complete
MIMAEENDVITSGQKRLDAWNAWVEVEGNFDKKNPQHTNASDIAKQLSMFVEAGDVGNVGIYTTVLYSICKGLDVFKKGGSKTPYAITQLISARRKDAYTSARAYAEGNQSVLSRTKISAKSGGGTISMMDATLDEQLDMFAESEAHAAETLWRTSYSAHANGKQAEPNTYSWNGEDLDEEGFPLLTYTAPENSGGES